MKKIMPFLIAMLMSVSFGCRAQRLSVSTNILGYAALGTMNIEGSYSISRRVSITAGAEYNPFTFRKDNPDQQIQLRQRSGSLGLRFWPWHTWSGWWFAGKGRFQEYNFGGILSEETDEGDRLGVGLYTGYTHMLSRHFNVEFGLGLWAGADFYRRYSCTICGTTVGAGIKAFLLPDDIAVSVVYVF